MVITTRKQRERLLEVYRRTEIFAYDRRFVSSPQYHGHQPATYRDFRRNTHATFGCDDAVVVNWCGMWICIETDGYAHT